MEKAMSEKGPLLPSDASAVQAAPAPPVSRFRRACRWAIISAFCLFGVAAIVKDAMLLSGHSRHARPGLSKENSCPQVRPLAPSNTTLVGLLESDYGSDTFKGKSAELLGASVQIETESYDDLGEVGDDERWNKFEPFHRWLEGAFPLTHSALKKETVNTWGLVYTWRGTDESLKPLLITAHQDVVPVLDLTVDQWVHPPYSGYFDGEWIWGRGSCDDKAGLVGTMIAVESLVRHAFQPTRTVVLAFGFDEETLNLRGAGHIGPFLLERYGANSFAMIVDEGAGYSSILGQMFATPAVGEKGYLDARITVNTKGGHSSVPPPHTGIGILSSFLKRIEAHPYEPKLDRLNPLYATLQCIAAYSPDLPKKIKREIKKSISSDKALERVSDWAINLPAAVVLPIGASLMGTTQAVTIIQGGVKANALPEQSYAVINHRIKLDSSVSEVQQSLTSLLAPTVSKYNLSLTAFGQEITPSSGKAGSVILSDAFIPGFEPAPVTPVEGPAWELLGGTIKAVYASTPKLQSANEHEKEKEIVIAPSIMAGNTDTHHYWALSKNIFRYAHLNPTGIKNGFHTVNEAMEINNFLGHIRFVTTLILNADEALF